MRVGVPSFVVLTDHPPLFVCVADSGKKENVKHALSECKFYLVIFDVLNNSWGPTKSLGSVDNPDDNSTGPITAKDMAKP